MALNKCQVKDFDTWYQCIKSAVKYANPGYCVSSELVKEHDESVTGNNIALYCIIVRGYCKDLF